jgi:hypothetical protein
MNFYVHLRGPVMSITCVSFIHFNEFLKDILRKAWMNFPHLSLIL